MNNESPGGTCYICGHGNPDVIQGHHIIPRRYDGTDEGRNIVDLCPSCHDAIERIYDDSFFEELGVEKVSRTDGRSVQCGHPGCTSEETYHFETETHDIWLCEGHRRCAFDDCDKIGTPVPRYDSDFIQVCDEHRVCKRDSCLNRDVTAYELEHIGGRLYCDTHAEEWDNGVYKIKGATE